MCSILGTGEFQFITGSFRVLHLLPTGGVNNNTLHGSSHQHIVFRSKIKRPFYPPERLQQMPRLPWPSRRRRSPQSRQLAAKDERHVLAS